jgi:hypothetical protein
MRPLNSLTTAVSAVLILGAVGATAACSSSKSGGGPSTPPASSPAATPTPTATDSTTLSAAVQVAQWYQGVQGHFGAIQTDTEAIKTAAQNQQVGQLPKLCGQLRDDVAAVKKDPQAPQKQLSLTVAAAMAAYGSAAQSCLAGNYAAAATGINSGAAYLTQANQIMNDLS